MSVSILDFGDAPEETMTIDRSLTGDELLINLKFNIE